MTVQIIDGKAIADSLRAVIKNQVKDRIANGYSQPGLATILVGDDPASQVYVRSKHRASEEAGMRSLGFNFPADTPQQKIEDLINEA